MLLLMLLSCLDPWHSWRRWFRRKLMLFLRLEPVFVAFNDAVAAAGGGTGFGTVRSFAAAATAGDSY